MIFISKYSIKIKLSVKPVSKQTVVRPRPAVTSKRYHILVKNKYLSLTDSTEEKFTQPVVYSTSVIITTTSKPLSSSHGRVGKLQKQQF